MHRGRILTGEVGTGEQVFAEVDIARRRSISRAHTATHMVHKAIREALGDTATQAGSENSPGRFRFDFNASSAVPVSVLRDVEARVNQVLLDDLAVRAEVMTQAQAREAGAMALFGEKYGDAVRVISVGDWARELCGGTHAEHTSQLGLVTLLGESSIGAGVRRVEALVGTDAYSFLARERAIVGQLTELMKGRPEELPERVHGLLGKLKDAERELDKLRREALMAAGANLIAGVRDLADDVRTTVLDVRTRLGDERAAVVAVTGSANGRPVIVVATNASARALGHRAGALVRVAAGVLGGGGGGKDDIAQGGGVDPSRSGDALAAVAAALGSSS